LTHDSHASHGHEPRGFLAKYVFSFDHKVIGVQYITMAIVMAFVAAWLAIVIRLQLASPKSDLVSPETYLSLVTMHGTIMVFFVLTTAPQSGFGNYFLPIQIGAEDMAFPVLNMLSFWTTFLSFGVMLAAFFVEGGAPLSGWTGYPPLSAVGEIAGPGQGAGQTLWVLSLALFCGASLMGAINFIATIIYLRAKGMTLMRMPLTCWAWFVTAILSLLGFAVLLSAGILLLLDRTAGTSFFIPGGLVINDRIIDHKGGSPLLYQHLFWFFGHPEVYIAILPGMGVASNLLSIFARKPIFGYKAMVWAILAIGFLGFVVWGHHMFMSGMNPYTAFAFSILTMCIGVPSAIKTFNWIGTLWGAKIRLHTPMLWALGFVSLFITGGLSGIFLGQPALDLFFHDTYFVVAHFHMIMGVAAIFGMFGGTAFWFPKMFGRMMNETWGKIHFYATFIGVYSIFTPMHYLGMVGNPRRYADFKEFQFMSGLMGVHEFMTWAAYFTVAAQVIFVVNLFWSMFKGKKAADNPWEATTLEWTIPSPPPFDNFAGKHPVVYRGPYEYATGNPPNDYKMQTDPPKPVVV
jgi:cytochrome c oxidase subunit 1